MATLVQSPGKSFFFIGQSLHDFAQRAETGAEIAGEWMAISGTETFHSYTVKNTPRDTGALREDIKQKPVMRDELGWEGGIYAELEYAPYVEHGTGLWGPLHSKYKIEPKTPGGVLAFYARLKTPEGQPILSNKLMGNLKEGELVFRRYVMHPGSPGQHMFAIGAAMTEGELKRIGNEGLRLMRNYVEKGIPV